jgi:hypothetical protein
MQRHPFHPDAIAMGHGMTGEQQVQILLVTKFAPGMLAPLFHSLRQHLDTDSTFARKP